MTNIACRFNKHRKYDDIHNNYSIQAYPRAPRKVGIGKKCISVKFPSATKNKLQIAMTMIVVSW